MLTISIILMAICVISVCIMLYAKYQQKQQEKRGFLVIGTLVGCALVLAPIVGLLCGIASLVMFANWCYKG